MQINLKRPVFVSFAFLLLLIAQASLQTIESFGRNVIFLNESKGKVEIYWINPHDRSTLLVSESHIFSGSVTKVKSFVGHEYEVVELPLSNSGVCLGADGECRRASFVVSCNEEQVVRITENFEVDFEDTKVNADTQATRLIDDCQAAALKELEPMGTATLQVTAQAMDKLVKCVHRDLVTRLAHASEENVFERKVRLGIAASLENHTCADHTLNSTGDLREMFWKGAKDRTPRKVHIKHDRPASQIHVIENFIKEEECRAIEKEAAAKSLHQATISDGMGGTRLSPARKAMSAGIKIKWDETNHPIARLGRRIFDYTNHVLELDINEKGQEDIMSIQYYGRGLNDSEPDRYMPHCDAGCTGLPHKWGGRIATMIMYCDFTDMVGGHTNFRNAGVHIRPEVGSAVFFSYIDPKKRVMDTGFTEHSGCPVYKGQKKIVTQWIRLGVDEENPWNSFNTLGISRKETELEDKATFMDGDRETTFENKAYEKEMGEAHREL